MKKYRRKENQLNAPIIPISKTIDPCSLSICRIHCSWFYNKKEACGTGFFIKIKNRDNNNLYQYFLMIF